MTSWFVDCLKGLVMSSFRSQGPNWSVVLPALFAIFFAPLAFAKPMLDFDLSSSKCGSLNRTEATAKVVKLIVNFGSGISKLQRVYVTCEDSTGLDAEGEMVINAKDSYENLEAHMKLVKSGKAVSETLVREGKGTSKDPEVILAEGKAAREALLGPCLVTGENIGVPIVCPENVSSDALTQALGQVQQAAAAVGGLAGRIETIDLTAKPGSYKDGKLGLSPEWTMGQMIHAMVAVLWNRSQRVWSYFVGEVEKLEQAMNAVVLCDLPTEFCQIEVERLSMVFMGYYYKQSDLQLIRFVEQIDPSEPEAPEGVLVVPMDISEEEVALRLNALLVQ